MSLSAIAKVFDVLSRVPPEVVDLVVDLVKAIAGSKTKDEAARRALAVASKAASEAALREKLG